MLKIEQVQSVYDYYVTRSREIARGVVLKTDTFNESGRRWWCVPVVDKLECDRVTCVEIDGARAEICRENFPGVTVHHNDLTKIRFDENEFDTILDLSTIDHIYDWESLLGKYHSWLKVGGEILLIVWLADKEINDGLMGTDIQYVFDVKKFSATVSSLFTVVSSRAIVVDGERTLTEFHCRKEVS